MHRPPTFHFSSVLPGFVTRGTSFFPFQFSTGFAEVVQLVRYCLDSGCGSTVALSQATLSGLPPSLKLIVMSSRLRFQSSSSFSVPLSGRELFLFLYGVLSFGILILEVERVSSISCPLSRTPASGVSCFWRQSGFTSYSRIFNGCLQEGRLRGGVRSRIDGKTSPCNGLVLLPRSVADVTLHFFRLILVGISLPWEGLRYQLFF